MDANELILAAFGRLGFSAERESGGSEYLAQILPDGTNVYIGANAPDGEPAGFPRTGLRCGIETTDARGFQTGRADFPDPVAAYTFVRFVSGWVQPEPEIVPEPANPYGTTPR